MGRQGDMEGERSKMGIGQHHFVVQRYALACDCLIASGWSENENSLATDIVH